MIRDKVYESIEEDDGFRNSDDDRIIGEYKSLNEDGKMRVNTIMTYICGWQLDTLIKAQNEGLEPHEVE